MAQLINNISAFQYQTPVGSVTYLKSINGIIQQEDYINFFNFIAYLQNLTKTDETYAMNITSNFGLKNKYNVPFVSLNINY